MGNEEMKPYRFWEKPAPAPLPEEVAFAIGKIEDRLGGSTYYTRNEGVYIHAGTEYVRTILAHISDLTRRLAEAEAELAEVRSRNGMLAVQRADAVHLAKANPTQAYQRIQQFKERAEATELRAAVLKQENEGLSSLCAQHEARVRELEAKADNDGRWETGFRNIVTRTIGPRASFDIPQIVDMVEYLWWLGHVARFREVCSFGGPWADDASDELDAIWQAALAATEAK